MNYVLATAYRHIRSTLAAPGMLIVFIAMPLVFSLFFGTLFSPGNGPRGHLIAIVLEERTGPALDFITELEANPNLRIRLHSEAEARELVEKRQVYGAFVFPSSFNTKVLNNEPFTVTLWREDQANLIIAAQQEVEKSLRRILAASVVANTVGEGDSGTYSDALMAFQQDGLMLKVESVVRGIAEKNDLAQMGIGMTVMFVMMSVVISAGVILEERRQGTWQRVLVAPVAKANVLLGFMLGLFIIAVVQFAILIFVQGVVFKAQWGSMAYFIPFASLFLLCAIAIGLAMAGVVKTFTQQSSVASLVMTATAMLSGILWPLEVMPDFMRSIAKFMPQYWAVAGFKSIMAGQPIDTLYFPAGVLLTITVLLFSFGVSRVKFE